MSEREACPKDELLALLDAGVLEPEEKLALEAHVKTCALCSESLEASREVGRALRAMPLPQPSAAARDRAYAAVLEAMEERAAAERTSRGRTSSGRTPGGRSPATLAPVMAAAKPVKRARFPGVALAGVALSAAACLFLYMGSLGRPEATAAREAIARADRDAVASAVAVHKIDDFSPRTQGAMSAPQQRPEAARPTVAAETGAAGGVAPVKESELANDADLKKNADAAKDTRKRESAETSRPGDVEVARLATIAQAREVLLEATLDESQRKVAERSFGDADRDAAREAPSKADEAPGARNSDPEAAGKAKADDEKAPAAPEAPRAADGAGAPAPLASKPSGGAAPRSRAPEKKSVGTTLAARQAGPAIQSWASGDRALILVEGRFYVADAAPGVSAVEKNGPLAVAPVGSVALASADDATVRRLALDALDRESASSVRDAAWARRVLALGDFLGLRPGRAPALESK